MSTQTFRYTNETFSGCDIAASVTMRIKTKDRNGKIAVRPYTQVIGEIQTISYSIHMDKTPVRSIGNVNAKDYVVGPRTIAGSLVFSVFNKHFAQNLMRALNEGYESGTAFLVDELPPFDITLSFANEYGYRARLVIYGIRLLNEGQVMSINDVFTENTYQFFATDLEYLTDEMKYIRDKKNDMYKLNDFIKWYEPYDPILNGANIKYYPSDSVINYLQEMRKKDIKLSTSIKQPTTPTARGIVDFFVDPPQDEGHIYIKDQDGQLTTITMKANKIDATATPDNPNPWFANNKVSYASIKLTAGTYTAYFENTQKRKSNTVKFKIQQIIAENPLDRYAPIIEKLTDTEAKFYSNEPLHDKLKIATYANGESGAFAEYDLKKRRCHVTGLLQKTEYVAYTYKKGENIDSKPVKFKTLSSKDIPYKQLELFVYANSAKLIFKDLAIYKDMMKECKDISEDFNISPMDAITKKKEDYAKQLKNLDKNTPNYEEKYEKLDLKIKVLSELLMLAMKMNNDLIANVNKQSLPIPIMFYDDNYDSCFSFCNDAKKAEFFKVYKHTVQYDQTVENYMFRKIKNMDNSFRYLGRPGLNHYVQAVNKNIRSPQLDFYILTDKEKEAFVKNDKEIPRPSQEEIEMYKSHVQRDFNKDLGESNSEKAFMINAKKSENPLMPTITLDSIDDNINLKTKVNSLVANKGAQFYVSFATSDDIINNNSIYKVPFTPNDEVVKVDPIINGLKDDKNYSMWIEDENFKQVSNPSTFTLNRDAMQDNSIKEYELKDELDTIETAAENCLPNNIKDLLLSTIQNNEYINSCNIINETLLTVLNQPITKDSLLKFLFAIKKYIGTIGLNADSFIYNLRCTLQSCSFDADKDGSIVIYKVTKDDVEIETRELESSNNIDIGNINADFILIAVHDKSLLFKSDMVFVNKVEKYVEVI